MLCRKRTRESYLRLSRRIDELVLERSELSVRVAELEARVAEAGRRALFPSRQHESATASRMAPASHAELADVGRALLFDTETPDAAA